MRAAQNGAEVNDGAGRAPAKRRLGEQMACRVFTGMTVRALSVLCKRKYMDSGAQGADLASAPTDDSASGKKVRWLERGLPLHRHGSSACWTPPRIAKPSWRGSIVCRAYSVYAERYTPTRAACCFASCPHVQTAKLSNAPLGVNVAFDMVRRVH